jgi:hypothetical protein
MNSVHPLQQLNLLLYAKNRIFVFFCIFDSSVVRESDRLRTTTARKNHSAIERLLPPERPAAGVVKLLHCGHLVIQTVTTGLRICYSTHECLFIDLSLVSSLSSILNTFFRTLAALAASAQPEVYEPSFQFYAIIVSTQAL